MYSLLRVVFRSGLPADSLPSGYVVTQELSEQHYRLRRSFANLSGVLAGVATPSKEAQLDGGTLPGVFSEIVPPSKKSTLNPNVSDLDSDSDFTGEGCTYVCVHQYC
jgi:hypothetical protein